MMKGRAIQRTKKKTMRLSATCEPAKNRREKRRKEDDERIKRSNDDDNDDAGRDSKGENKRDRGGRGKDNSISSLT